MNRTGRPLRIFAGGVVPEVPDDLVLSAGELFEELGGDVAEEDYAPALFETTNRLVEAEGGLWDEEGNGRVAIIRPCVSRGKKIRGLPPIYTPTALAESAGVFKNWPMYLDHVVEQALNEMAEQLREINEDLYEHLLEKARSVRELGGRIIESWYDPELVFEDDEEYGYQKGGVVGKYRPQPKVREMLEADPGILHVSINAWPKGARVGTAPWSPKTRGAMIEGIRRKPMGSVDFVFRGGAGGRPLLSESDDVDRAVSLLEGLYSPGADRGTPPMKTKKIAEFKSRDELLEALREENPELAEALAESPDNGGSGTGDGDPLTATRVEEMLEEFKTSLSGEMLTEEKVEERASELLEERDESRRLERIAHEKISELERNGLPKAWGVELRSRYAVLPSGPTNALLVEADEEKDKSAEDVLTERLLEDARHIVRLVRASGGRAVVTGLGPSEDEENEEVAESTEPNAFVDFLRESGDFEGDDEKDKTTLTEMVREGV